jgi:hypothetical protein
MISDAPSMAATAIHGCAFKPSGRNAISVQTKGDVIALHGSRVSGEIQRLRININRRVFVVLDIGGGYVQCGPEPTARAIYCEAQSAESWPDLARILTPERISRLRTIGFSEPGRAPNYWKTYPIAAFNDKVIADELLTVLFDVYGYNGMPDLEFKTEKGPG